MKLPTGDVVHGLGRDADPKLRAFRELLFVLFKCGQMTREEYERRYAQGLNQSPQLRRHWTDYALVVLKVLYVVLVMIPLGLAMVLAGAGLPIATWPFWSAVGP